MSTSLSSSRRRARRRRVLVFLAALGIVLAGCADGDEDADRGGDTSAVADETTGDDGSGGDDGGGDDGAAPVGDSDDGDRVDESASEALGFDAATRGDAFQEPGDVPADPLVTATFVGRDIIRTGEVVLETPAVDETTDRVIRTVFANGGAIWGQDSDSDPSPRSVLTIRIPAARFDTLMAELKRFDGVGGVSIVSQSVSTDDVTEVVVDLDARIVAAESSVTRVQTLLDDATDLNRIFDLEAELVDRQAHLERLLGQRKTIGDQVTLSTITATIIESDPDRLPSSMEVVAWLGETTELACPGSTDVSIPADGTAVLCIGISNTGEDVLTDIAVSAPRFRLRVDDFTPAPGPATVGAIGPGDDLILTTTLDADDGFIQRVDASDGLELDVEVEATPATATGAAVTGRDTVFISTDVDDPLPGFGDAFADGWGAMTYVASLVLLAIAIVLPFVPFLLLAGWIGRKLHDASRRRADDRAAFVVATAAAQAAGGSGDPAQDRHDG